MTTSPSSPQDDRLDTSPASSATGSSEPVRAEGAVEVVPFLPTLPPASPATPSAASNPAGGAAAGGPDLAEPSASPFIPAAVPVTPAPAEPAPFDAKAMVESQKRINANPAYGALPTATEASREAANELRAKAQRVRQRNKRIGWFVGVVFLGGVAAAGWYGYQAYQDEQDQTAIERAENAASDEPGQVDAASPLGQQVEVIDVLNDTNSGATASAGGLLDAVDDARAVVGEADGEPAAPVADASAAAIAVADVLPQIVLEVGERFPDVTGRETYVISADEFAAGDPAAFGKFVRLLSTQPQVGPTAPVFDTLPTVAADEIVISVDRNGDGLRRAIVWGADSQIYVDYTP